VEDWWGEGDEKVWVDDDVLPRWFGTGTEDYFGYANAKDSPFERPYRLLIHTGDAFGQVSAARFHLLDAIPFSSSLTFDLELYVAPDARDRLPPPAPEDFRLP
jgi:hypothetical protein